MPIEFRKRLTPRLTGAGARSAQGTNTGHENGEAMASVGVRVEPPVRLGSVVEGGVRLHGLDLNSCCTFHLQLGLPCHGSGFHWDERDAIHFRTGTGGSKAEFFVNGHRVGAGVDGKCLKFRGGTLHGRRP